MNNRLPAEFEPSLEKFTSAPAHVRSVWRYAIVVALINDEKAKIVEMHQDGETLHLIVQTAAGDRFGVSRPPMSDETEQALLEQIREIVADEQILRANYF